mgnify:CR=1 FL=1
MTKIFQSIGGIDVTRRKKKKLARRMGFRHYRDAKAVKYAADILMRMSHALEESSWPKRDDITKLQEDYANDMSRVYRHVLVTGQVPQNDREFMEVMSNG